MGTGKAAATVRSAGCSGPAGTADSGGENHSSSEWKRTQRRGPGCTARMRESAAVSASSREMARGATQAEAEGAGTGLTKAHYPYDGSSMSNP